MSLDNRLGVSGWVTLSTLSNLHPIHVTSGTQYTQRKTGSWGSSGVAASLQRLDSFKVATLDTSKVNCLPNLGDFRKVCMAAKRPEAFSWHCGVVASWYHAVGMMCLDVSASSAALCRWIASPAEAASAGSHTVSNVAVLSCLGYCRSPGSSNGGGGTYTKQSHRGMVCVGRHSRRGRLPRESTR